MNEKAFVFDLDSTLALNVTGRSWFDQKRVEEDAVNPDIKEILDLILNSGNYQIIIMTARSSECMEETIRWMRRHKIHWDKILMRNPMDDRSSADVKEDLFVRFVQPFFKVMAAFDDDPGVAAMWKRNGVNCMLIPRKEN